MRILHIRNIANYGWQLAQAQRRLGHDAVVWAQGASLYGFPCDDTIASSDPVRWNLSMLRRWSLIRDFDVVHIHGGIWPTQVAFRLMKNFKAVHYHGSETRSGKGMSWQSIADVKFISTPDLQRYHPDAIWAPQPIDLPELGEHFEHDVPMFAHFVRGNQKGTPQVIEMFSRAFGPLQHLYLEFPQGGRKDFYIGEKAELWVFEGIPHDGVEQVIKAADVVFDQISPYGIYGYVSVEAMAHERPVLATLNRALYPSDCPVVYPRVTKLMELARDMDTRLRYGELGRAYVERVHDSSVVAQRVLDAYRR